MRAVQRCLIGGKFVEITNVMVARMKRPTQDLTMRLLHMLIPVTAILLAVQPVHAADIDSALRAYERGDYARAHDELLGVARRGDPQAQELLGFMYAVGPQVFPGVHQDLGAAAVLLERAARAGRPAAKSLHCALARRGTMQPSHKASCFDDAAAASAPLGAMAGRAVRQPAE